MQMLFLLTVAAVIAAAIFFLMDSVAGPLADRYVDESTYTEKRNQKLIAELQEYITGEHLHSRDAVKLNQWIRKQPILSVSIYKDGIQVFDSDYPDQEIWDAEIRLESLSWQSYETLMFSDGPAEIVMTGAYRYQLYTCIRIFEIAVSFFIFLVIVLMGIRGKMKYIQTLSEEVKVLEGGSLHCPITVRGRDELSILAEGLESMRNSFVESQKKEAEIVLRNQKVITEMSHDLRTPVTAILLYTEILKKEKDPGAAQAKTYVEKIDNKALQLKHRIDKLLNYSLTAENNRNPDLTRESFTTVFYDLLSEACIYLEQNGFHVDAHIQWSEKSIRFNADYIVRITDNIISNIVKYADPQYPVTIIGKEERDTICLTFQNRAALPDNTIESAGVGIQSVRNMIREMGGVCLSDCTDHIYSILISFIEDDPG